MTNKESPAMMPGVCARGIDANHNDYTATHTPEQVKAGMRKYYAEELAEHENTIAEKWLFLLAYCTGYAPGLPVGEAFEIAKNVLDEERSGKHGRNEK